MANEKTLAHYMTKGLRKVKGCHPQRHEDALSAGIADMSVAYRGRTAWVELKYLQCWPVREGTPVRIASLTPLQVQWLTLRGRAGGNTWLLLQVGEPKEWLLLNYKVVDLLYKRQFTLTDLRQPGVVTVSYLKRVDFEDLADRLTM